MIRVCCVLIAFLLAPGAWSQSSSDGDPAKAERLRDDLRGLVALARDRVFPALVNINVVTVSYFGGKERKGQSVGSGTIISREGYVLTNAHVTNQGKRFRVTFSDRREVGAELVGEDPLTDLAVLRIDLADLGDPERLPVAALGDSDLLEIGDTVLAMGSPFALSRSVTLGIVSNTERVFASANDDAIDAMQEERGERSGLFTRWIQHDAAINPGNSGGPLVNLRGEVVGVNTLGGANLGFASPSNLARDISEKLIRFGEVPRSWIGATFRHLVKTGHERGVLVTSVISGGPADKAGVQAGDLVVAIDGEPVTIRFPEEVPPFLRRLADTPIGGTISLSVVRDGESLDLSLLTERLLRDRGAETTLRGWGISIREITDKTARDRRLDSTEGALVSGIRPASPAAAAEPALGPGDVIRAVDGEPVRNYEDLVRAYRALTDRETAPERVLVEFDRRGKSQVTLIKPRPDRRDDPPRELPKAWLGVATQPVLRDLAEAPGGPGTVGFRITRVYPGTLAADADLRVGDVITAFNGERLTPRGPQDAGSLQRLIRRFDEGERAVLTVMRAGTPVEVPVTLERTRYGPEEARKVENRDFEMIVRELTFFDRDDQRWNESVAGALVESVERAGWAGLAGIEPGDLVQSIRRTPIRDVDDFRREMESLAKDQPSRVEFVVLRDNRTFFKFAEPDWKPKTKEEERLDDEP